MRVVRPVSITDDMVLSTTLVEAHDTWSGSVTYAAADRVIDSAGRWTWQSLQDANVGHQPPADDSIKADDWWVRVGASQRRAPFDGEVSVQAAASGRMSLTIRPGPIGALGLFGLDGAGILRATLRRPSEGVVWQHESGLYASQIDTMYEFFYAPRDYAREAVVVDIPAFADGELTIELEGADTLKLGELVVGMPYDLGDVLMGASLGISDFSRRERDDFGRYTLVKRDIARTMRLPLWFTPERLGKVYLLYRVLGSVPCMWIPSAERRYSSMALLGIYTDMTIDVPSRTINRCTLALEGLPEPSA